MRLSTFLLPLLVALAFLFSTGTALKFALRQGEETCISKEVLENDSVNGQFNLIPDNEQITVSVRDPIGDLVYLKPGVSDGSFAYTSPKTGAYKVCFQNNLTQGLKTMNLKFSSREETSSQQKARKVSLQPIEAQIKQIQKMVSAVQKEDAWQADQQKSMRERNELMGTYVMMFNIVLILIVTAGYFIQMWYLKQYFVSKRIIY